MFVVYVYVYVYMVYVFVYMAYVVPRIAGTLVAAAARHVDGSTQPAGSLAPRLADQLQVRVIGITAMLRVESYVPW